MDVLAACLQALYRKWQINKVLRSARSQLCLFVVAAYSERACAPRMAQLSIHGCTCCVPASVVSKVADKQSTAKCWEPEAQVRPFGITRTALCAKDGAPEHTWMYLLRACKRYIDSSC